MGRAYEVRKASIQKTGAARGKIYSTYAKEIYQAAKNGGTEMESNSALKRLVERAKKEQVPADIIKRAIDKVNSGVDENYVTVSYELFGPAGSTLIVECLTDNHNRTQTDVKVAFQKTGGKIASSGSVTYQFKHLAVFVFKGISEEDAVMALLDADCDVQNTYTETDEETGDELVTVEADYSEYNKIRQALGDLGDGIEFLVDKISWETDNMVDLTDEKEIDQFERLLAMLEDLDDVQDVYHNVNWEVEEE